jgi:UDP-glucuronate decarboxylase
MRDLAGKTAVVAGGAGFLGSHLCEVLLAEGARVICMDNFQTGRQGNIAHLLGEARFEVIDRDVIAPLPASLRRARLPIDYIYNLACAASPPHYQADPEHTMLTSVVGTHNLLRLAEDKRARFLLASTSEIYGDPEVHPQREDYWGNVNPTGPRACYDEGKRAAEALSFDYGRARRADVRVARIFNTYGPRMRPDDGRVVSNVITQALAGVPVTIYGDGSQTRSFCYVDDTVAALKRLAEHAGPVPGPVNVGTTLEIAVTDLAERVIAMTASTSRIVERPLPKDDPRRRRPDISLAKALLGWSPRVPLETGLRATIEWFATQRAMPEAPASRPASRPRLQSEAARRVTLQRPWAGAALQAATLDGSVKA